MGICLGMLTVGVFGNLLLKSNHILTRNEDGSGEIYLEGQDESITVEYISKDLEDDNMHGLLKGVITGANFIRIRNGKAQQIPREDFRHVVARLISRLEDYARRRELRKRICELRETPHTINGRPAMF